MTKTPAPLGPHPGTSLPQVGYFRYSGALLMGALVLLFVVLPFVEDLPTGEILKPSLIALVMVFAVLAVRGTRWTLATVLALLIPALGGKWASHFAPGLVPAPVSPVATMLFFAFVVALILRFILRTPRVDANVLCAGLSGYLMLGLLWVPAYTLTAHLTPGAFAFSTGHQGAVSMEGLTAFYFSFITLCTVGYGDVTPVSNVARMLVVTEVIAGLFYITVLISRLVAVYSTQNLPGQAEASAASMDSQST